MPLNKFNPGNRPFQPALRIGQKVLQPEQKIVVSAKNFVDTTKHPDDMGPDGKTPEVACIIFLVKFAGNILPFPTKNTQNILLFPTKTI